MSSPPLPCVYVYGLDVGGLEVDEALRVLFGSVAIEARGRLSRVS